MFKKRIVTTLSITILFLMLWSLNTQVSYAKFILEPREFLNPGEELVSPDNKFHFLLQEDGNLVLLYHDQPYWESHTMGFPERLVMQEDGNLVLYFQDAPPWTTNTAGKGLSSLVVQHDGNVAIYQKENGSTWATNTGGIEFRPITREHPTF